METMRVWSFRNILTNQSYEEPHDMYPKEQELTGIQCGKRRKFGTDTVFRYLTENNNNYKPSVTIEGGCYSCFSNISIRKCESPGLH